MKKRRILWHRIIIVVAILFLLLFNFNRIRLAFHGYSFSEQTTILKYDKENIKEYLDEEISFESWDKQENNHHYYDYQFYKGETNSSTKESIEYVDSYYERKDELETLGYTIEIFRGSIEEISMTAYEQFIDENIDYDTASTYLKINGCIAEDIPEYIETNKKPLKAVLSVSYPFISSENEVTRTYLIKDPSNLLVFVKEGFQVSSDYVPEDLVETEIGSSEEATNTKLRKEASDALTEMNNDAKKKGYSLLVNSAYRSYDDQQEVYDYYFQIYDSDTAASLVAIPGCSEHQLGLSVDLTSQSVEDGEYSTFGETNDFEWVEKNAYKYGFIIRYPEDKTDITGTTNEPWHLRYVGKEAAKIIYENDWTLEEYILKYGFDYDLTILSNKKSEN